MQLEVYLLWCLRVCVFMVRLQIKLLRGRIFRHLSRLPPFVRFQPFLLKLFFSYLDKEREKKVWEDLVFSQKVFRITKVSPTPLKLMHFVFTLILIENKMRFIYNADKLVKLFSLNLHFLNLNNLKFWMTLIQ